MFHKQLQNLKVQMARRKEIQPITNFGCKGNVISLALNITSFIPVVICLAKMHGINNLSSLTELINSILDSYETFCG